MDETNRPLILVVEDEPMLARIVCDALRQSGYDAASAPDGERGLAMFSELRPALVVTDVMMPRSDGFRLTRRIRSVDREVPILFLSARSSSDDVVEGFASGGDDYLRKALRHERAAGAYRGASGGGAKAAGRPGGYMPWATTPSMPSGGCSAAGRSAPALGARGGHTGHARRGRRRHRRKFAYPGRDLGRRQLLCPAQPQCLRHAS